MKALGFVFLFCTLVSIELAGQFYSSTSNYRFNTFLLNPAVAGTESSFAGFASFQHQIPSLNSASMSRYSGSISGHGLVSDRFGLGVSLTTDNSSFTRRSGFQVASSYLVPAGEGKFSFGIVGGMEYTKEILGYYPESGYKSGAFGSGVQYKCSKWFAGVSVVNLLHYSTSSYFYPPTIWTATGGYRFEVSNIAIEPAATIFYLPTYEFVAVDIVTKALFLEDRYMLGVGYRNFNPYETMFSMLAGLRIKEWLNLYYSFDFGLFRPEFAQQITIGIKARD